MYYTKPPFKDSWSMAKQPGTLYYKNPTLPCTIPHSVTVPLIVNIKCVFSTSEVIYLICGDKVRSLLGVKKCTECKNSTKDW